jgi:DNA-binding MarR family transcriptional regulator
MKSSREAKEESRMAILRALHGRRDGRRFGYLKEETGFHQSTVSSSLKEMISERLVEYDPIKRVYRISSSGLDSLETRELIELIERSSKLLLASRGGSSVRPDDNLIVQSSVAYSFPAVNFTSLGTLKRFVHKLYTVVLIDELARNHVVDASSLIEGGPIGELVMDLKRCLGNGKQAFAFTFDLGIMTGLINDEYLMEVARLAKLGDDTGIRSDSQDFKGYSDRWLRYGLEKRALEYIKEQGGASLSQISAHLKLDEVEVESILERLLPRDGVPGEMMIFAETGQLIQRIKLRSDTDEVQIPDGGGIKVKVNMAKPLILRSRGEQEPYYTFPGNEPQQPSSE